MIDIVEVFEDNGSGEGKRNRFSLLLLNRNFFSNLQLQQDLQQKLILVNSKLIFNCSFNFLIIIQSIEIIKISIILNLKYDNVKCGENQNILRIKVSLINSVKFLKKNFILLSLLSLKIFLKNLKIFSIFRNLIVMN